MKAIKLTRWLLPLALCTGCPAADDFTPPPPLVAFGDLVAGLSPTGDTLAVPVYLTRALAEEIRLPLFFAGTAVRGIDYFLPDGDELLIPAGENTPTLRMVAGDTPDLLREAPFVDLRLQPHPAVEISERDSMRVVFSVPHTVQLSIWAPPVAFPQLWGYSTHGDEPVPSEGRINQHFAFAHPSRSRANVIGLYNTQAGKSTNALNMHRLYAEQDVSSASANIRIPEFIELIPEAEGAARGSVRVIPQRVTVFRMQSSGRPPFTVGISGEGSYDENTRIISLRVSFDETEIGGAPDVVRRYSLETQQRN